MTAPRSCIGQEFAYMEAKIILALTLRKFDFVSMYSGTPFQVYAITGKPVDGMPMRVSLVT
jgi:cytochrome P450